MTNEPASVAIIGAGAVGSALAQRMVARGYAVAAVISRTRTRADKLAKAVGARHGSDRLADLPEDATLTFCCVPDDVVSEVATALADLDQSWQGRLVAHTAGALTAGALAPLDECDAHTLSFHPMQTFPLGVGAAAFEGIYVGLEGGAESVAWGRRVAEALGVESVVLDAEAKTRYHLAASIASNFFVTLTGLSLDVLASTGIERDEGLDVMAPLIEGTWRNQCSTSPEAALTGPIVRGDGQTVARHLDAMHEHLPHLVPVYVALAGETVRLARRVGRLDGDTARALTEVLRLALEK